MFNSLREWFNAWRRGEKRIGPKGGVGRVYIKRHPPEGSLRRDAATARPKGSISARHWVEAEKRWVDLGLIAESEDE